MPEIKKFTNLNIEKELRSCLQSDDYKTIETIYDISYFFLTDHECTFIYDLADEVSVKHVGCYLRQYWKAFWNVPSDYPFMVPFILQDLLKEGFLKYSANYSKRDHQHLYDFMYPYYEAY